VTFSDGHPFSADDVVFTFDWVMNPKVAAPRSRSLLEISPASRRPAT
jgi:peptide/nickel transport system substrate-binding protein